MIKLLPACQGKKSFPACLSLEHLPQVRSLVRSKWGRGRLSLSLSNSKEHWEDGSGISVTSFLACRESWRDRKLPGSVLSLKSLLCIGFVNSRQLVSSPSGTVPCVPTASFMPWAAPSHSRDTVLEGTGKSLMFKGFVVTFLSTGKEK